MPNSIIVPWRWTQVTFSNTCVASQVKLNSAPKPKVHLFYIIYICLFMLHCYLMSLLSTFGALPLLFCRNPQDHNKNPCVFSLSKKSSLINVWWEDNSRLAPFLQRTLTGTRLVWSSESRLFTMNDVIERRHLFGHLMQWQLLFPVGQSVCPVHGFSSLCEPEHPDWDELSLFPPSSTTSLYSLISSHRGFAEYSHVSLAVSVRPGPHPSQQTLLKRARLGLHTNARSSSERCGGPRISLWADDHLLASEVRTN